ncbi:MAG: hypothetical protein Q9162_006560 [Coniocarpon cinnabarinum]
MLPTANSPIAATPRSPLTYGEPPNTLTQPDGDAQQLLLSEGAYVLRDIITLGAIPPPPSEHTSIPVNVLDPKPQPPTAAPHLSLINLVESPFAFTGHDAHPLSDRNAGEDSPQKRAGPTNGTSRLSHLASGNLKGYVRGNTTQTSNAPKTPSSRDSRELIKRKKPKASLLKSNSSMIARVNPQEGLSKRLQDHKPEGYFAFVNNSRAFLWMDLSSSSKAQQLVKVLYTRAHPLCHDVNPHTKSPVHLDVVIGFSSADIMWYEPMSQKYSHLNKNVRNVIYDKEKDDAAFVAEDFSSPLSPAALDGRRSVQLEVRRSMKATQPKANPVAVYKATRQRINAIEFSFDGQHLAIVCEDGSLRILDLEHEELTDLYTSYYGGLSCIAWSPDNRIVITGGQDDIVSVWSLEERSLIARCSGHRSWVSDVRFDRWKCDRANYRFGSVGEDGRLLLWDFSTGLVQRPRAASMRPSVVSLVRSESAMASRTSLIRSIESPKLTRDSEEQSSEDNIVHPVQSRAQVATLPPIFNKVVDEHPLSAINFIEDAIIVTCSVGHIQTYDRPKGTDEEGASVGDESTGSAFSNPFK